MSQNTLKVHDLNEDAEFDENGVEVFDEKALVEEEPSDNDYACRPGQPWSLQPTGGGFTGNQSLG